jgi:beta-phosphoglucomutase
MGKMSEYVALFDFDGVIMDTESQYSIFWDEKGMRYLHLPNFCSLIKGQTLNQIYDKYFPEDKEWQDAIRQDLYCFESSMTYNYIPGAYEFLVDLRRNGIRTAIVTSSNNAKMTNVYKAHPDFKKLSDTIITADMFFYSKPNPECFLKGMKELQCEPVNAVVFEDSFHGLDAGRASGAKVVGLATTNSRQTIEDKADRVIDNFIGLDAKWLTQFMKSF